MLIDLQKVRTRYQEHPESSATLQSLMESEAKERGGGHKPTIHAVVNLTRYVFLTKI